MPRTINVTEKDRHALVAHLIVEVEMRHDRLIRWIKRWQRKTVCIGSDGVRSRHIPESELRRALLFLEPPKRRATR